jgi:hypothetical protein
LLEETRHNLEQLKQRKLDGMMVRSRVQWIQEGEKPSHYFCSLEKCNFLNKRMCFLEKANDDILYDDKEILQETMNFYEKLYSRQPVEDVNLSTLVNDTVKLNEEEKESLEGLITLAEAHAALRNMKNNKSPGSDGFTTEFYKCFFLGYW